MAKERAIKEVEVINSNIKLMDRFSMTSEDVNVAKFILFVKVATGMLYADSDMTRKVSLAEANEAFHAGCVLNVNGVEHMPISKTHHAASGSDVAYCDIAYIKPNATTSSQADIAIARSTDV